MIYADPVHVELYSFQDRILRRNYIPPNGFFRQCMPKSACDEVAQENVGTNSLKVLTFISHVSSDQLPVVVAMRAG